jgi:Arc/MetJ-type ribon-helix-helix transcriptional regulator
MTKNWRLSVSLTKELEDEIVKLRKEDAYCRMSYADLIRVLIERGLKASEEAAV